MKNDICSCKIEYKTTRNKRSSGCILQIIIRSIFKTSDIMSYSWKLQISWAIPEKSKKNRGVEDILFRKSRWNFSFIYFTPGNSRQIKAPPLEIAQNCVTSWKFQDQKPRPLEVPHNFFLVTPWKFLMLFLWCPNKFHILNPVLIFSGIAQCFHLILVGISSILILSKNRWVWGGGGLLWTKSVVTG